MKLTIRLLLVTALTANAGLFGWSGDPTFHLKNKSKGDIQIDVMQGTKSLTGLRSIAKNGDLMLPVDISKPTTATIYYCPTTDYCKTNFPDKMIAKFKTGKTIYIKFDANNKIAPQKGNSATGKTTSGYSAKNNVTKADISMQMGKTEKSELGVGGMRKNEMPQRQEPQLTSAGKTGPVRPGSMLKQGATQLSQEEESGLSRVGKTGPVRPGSMLRQDATQLPDEEYDRLSGQDAVWAQFPKALKIKMDTYDPKTQSPNKWDMYCAVLGIDPKSSKTTIAKAYRDASRTWRPDKHPNEEKLATDVQKLLNEAYNYLKQ